jgi:HSP20 family protein
MAQEIKKQEPTGAAVPRYQDPFTQVRREMDRLFDSFLDRGFFGFPSVQRMVPPAIAAPEIDVRETDKEIVFEAELPGLDENDVSIVLRDGVLSLKGEKKSKRDEKNETYHLVERSYGTFERSFRLPETIDEDQIKAPFDKGIPHIVVPKRPESMKAEKRIPVGKS